MTSTDQPEPANARYLGQCYQRDDGTPHPPHVVDIGQCLHEPTTYCYGVPEPGSIEATIAELKPGQRVLVVWEGVVRESIRPRHMESSRSAVTLASSEEGDLLVLRYQGTPPTFLSDSVHRPADARKVAGKLNGGLVGVKVLPPDHTVVSMKVIPVDG